MGQFQDHVSVAKRSLDEATLEELEVELINIQKRVDRKREELSLASMCEIEMQAKIWSYSLPLGAFAFSSGLESLVAHKVKQLKDFELRSFISHSIASVARLSLPYLLETHRKPNELLNLDQEFDASTPCTVARRASVAQGRALLTVWEKSFRPASRTSKASCELSRLSKALRTVDEGSAFEASAHLPPVFGAVARASEVDEYTAAYTFLLSHSKAVLSAAVRAGILGPFQAQAFLASTCIRKDIEQRVAVAAKTTVYDAGQVWVSGDVWIGRHEILYSRIFNS